MGDYLGSVALPSMKMRQRKLCQIRQQPRAAPVYKDSSNFGVRMLEKLGWSEGKGLGKREDGMAAPIMPKIKQDAEGVGYAGEKDDHWTQHDQDFNQLLKSLNGEEAPAEREGDLMKMKSLEEKSKNSRARVHYKKFTRGKDLSRASEKDLANIFGKKTLDEVKNQTVVAEVEVDKEIQDGEQDPDESNVMGLTTIKACMSVQDYFKSKMQEKFGVTKANPVIEQETVGETEEVPSKKKSKKSKKSIDLDETVADPSSEEVVDNGEEISKKRKKKTKSKDDVSGTVQELNLTNGVVEEEPEQEEPRKKKSKKEKRTKIAQEELSLDGTETKKKKSKKDKSQQLLHDQPLEIEEPVKKKSKKNNRKRSDEEVDLTSQLDQQTEEIQASPSEEVLTDASTEEGDASIKKKKKEKTEEEEVAHNVEDDEITCRVKVSVLKQLDESGFPGSNYADIVGYGLSQEVKLIKRESHRKKNLEKHQFIRQKQMSFQRKRQMLKKVSAFKRI
ncbi:PIN2/TERF1-interacting telomerase inhibitor 1-like [Ochlerotatus camptorhynchus]|uniref:PIN2/TERF1-interacting telomerase inhibitor 1-like n=1 Tax=Ochlerotatus camptorhynchus TaxID=644619 RepID=UPI0031DF049C